MPWRQTLAWRWLHTHLMSLDWQTRHEYLETVMDSVSPRQRKLIQKNVVEQMSPSDLLQGTCTGKKVPKPNKRIVAADFPRQPKKRQLTLPDMFEEQRRKLSKH